MRKPNKLKGKEDQIMLLYEQGLSEFKIAIMFQVYPNAIRHLVKRELREREEAQFAGSK